MRNTLSKNATPSVDMDSTWSPIFTEEYGTTPPLIVRTVDSEEKQPALAAGTTAGCVHGLESVTWIQQYKETKSASGCVLWPSRFFKNVNTDCNWQDAARTETYELVLPVDVHAGVLGSTAAAFRGVSVLAPAVHLSSEKIDPSRFPVAAVHFNITYVTSFVFQAMHFSKPPDTVIGCAY
jgi:hypothetical protein